MFIQKWQEKKQDAESQVYENVAYDADDETDIDNQAEDVIPRIEDDDDHAAKIKVGCPKLKYSHKQTSKQTNKQTQLIYIDFSCLSF